jgi:O-antigen/teichoic acid export membrane protein
MEQQVKSEDSLRKRYVYKLVANLVGLPITLATQAIIPRMLAPAAYGNFGFLTTFFSQVVSFFDTGLSSGLYSKMSQRPLEQGVLRFFWGLVGIISTLVILFVSGIFGLGLSDRLWPAQDVRYIWMAAVWGLLAWYTQIVNKVLDAYGLTVSSEIVRVQQRVLGLGLILLMFWLRRLSLTEFFLYQYAILIILLIGWWIVLRRNNQALFPTLRLTLGQIKGYGREFYDYSAPLLIFAFVGLFNGLQDRWFLQQFAGSVEQGFYTLSYQVGALCFLVSGAMTPLFWRDISKAFGEQNESRMRELVTRYVPLMYLIAVYFGVFVMVQADKISLLLGGNAYQQATIPIAIMALYPIHQTYGQLSASFLLGTGETKLYRNLGISVMALDLVLTFWLLAPSTLFGLGLGATGLALKMVIIQFIGVNLQFWFVARSLRLSFWKFLSHQFYSVILLAALAWSSAAAFNLMFNSTLLAFFASGVLYTLGFAGVVFLFPSILSMSRGELQNQLTWVWQALLRRLAR